MSNEIAQTPEDKADGPFLIPEWTISQDHPKASVVEELFHTLNFTCKGNTFLERRFNALCCILVGVNQSKHHKFRLSQNKNEYGIQQWPVPYRAMVDVLDKLLEGDTPLLNKVTGYFPDRRTTVFFAPEGSRLIMDDLFPVARLDWLPPVIQVKSAKRGANGKYLSNNLDVEFHQNSQNGPWMKKYMVPKMEHLNRLAMEHEYDTQPYEFRQWARKFRGGVNDAGGRLYADYQSASGLSRLNWLIDGEAVAEIDVTACGPTLLACWHDQQHLVDGLDPYQVLVDEINGMTRPLAKKICQIAVGNNKLSAKRFPDSIRKSETFKPILARLSWAKVRSVIERQLPYLLNPDGNTNQSLMLQAHESDWLMKVLRELLEQGVGCLPVHESIIVPRSKIEVTKEAMSSHFEACFGIRPLLDVEMS